MRTRIRVGVRVRVRVLVRAVIDARLRIFDKTLTCVIPIPSALLNLIFIGRRFLSDVRFIVKFFSPTISRVISGTILGVLAVIT
jgi:hypothetical protein